MGAFRWFGTRAVVQPEPARLYIGMRPPVVLQRQPEAPRPEAAAFRLDQILRDRERRKKISLPRHGDHDIMTGEALQHLGTLVREGVYTFADACAAVERLKAAE